MIDKRAMLEAVLEAREEEGRLEGQLAEVTKNKKDAEKKLLDHLETTGEKSVKMETSKGLMLMVRSEKLRVSVKKENQEELLKWVDEDCGRPDMIKPTIHHQTLTGFINRRIKDCESVPKFIEMYFQPILSIRSGKTE